MFLCFLPAYAIVRSDKNKVISPISRLFFLALTAAAVFLAADEMLGIHERVGEKMGNATNLGAGTFLEGFAWVFIYGPIILGGFVLFAYTVRDVMKYLTSETWGKLKRILLIIAIAIGTILALEVGEAYLCNILGIRSSLMTLVEESRELVVICGYFRFMQLMYLETEARPS